MLRLIFVVLVLLINLTVRAEETTDIFKIRNLERELEHAKGNIGMIEDRLSRHASDISEIESKISAFDSAILNFKEPGKFQRINTSVGMFFISAEEAIPYLNGYKLSLSIGNPYYAIFDSPKLQVIWYAPYSEAMEINEWLATIKKKEFSLSKDILPGKWNKVEIILNPCSMDELQRVKINLDFQSILLGDKK